MIQDEGRLPTVSASLRGEARQSVAEKWANRRKLQEASRQAKATTTINVHNNDNDNNNDTAINRRKQQPQPMPFLPLCVTLRRAWKDAVRNLQGEPSSSSTSTTSAASQKPQQHQPRQKQSASQRGTFPSVLSVLQANALKEEVEASFTRHDQGDGGDDLNVKENNNNKNNMFLPTHYDFHRAIVNMSQSRSRVFLLLDLAAIVRTHVAWKKRLAIGSNTQNDNNNNNNNNSTIIQMVYATKHNSSPKLLQVLQRLGVQFKVSTKYDLEQVSRLFNSATTAADDDDDNKHVNTARNEDSRRDNKCTIWDDPERLAKPNSYYRSLILDNNNLLTSTHGDNDDDDDESVCRFTVPLAVNGPDEVLRLASALESIARRRRQTMPPLSFILKLDPTDTTERWKELIEATMVEASRQRQRAETSEDGDGNDATNRTLVGIALELADDGKSRNVLDSLTNCLGEMSKLSKSKLQLHLTPPPTTRTMDSTTASTTTDQSRPRHDNHDDAPLLTPQWVEWLSKPQQSFSRVTIDMSHLLVANAGALCTRIIGVKQNEAGKIHYYIDDGCYGSLSNTTTTTSNGDDTETNASKAVPMPLLDHGRRVSPNYGNNDFELKRTSNDDDGSLDVNVGEDGEEELLATVWGPTCDGLDKVCSDLPLPRLGRDDWLVFGNLGFCHVGTNFNGFSPPDVVYCVLGGGYYLYHPNLGGGAAETKTMTTLNHDPSTG